MPVCCNVPFNWSMCNLDLVLSVRTVTMLNVIITVVASLLALSQEQVSEFVGHSGGCLCDRAMALTCMHICRCTLNKFS